MTALRPGGAQERDALDRGWYYVREPEPVPSHIRELRAGDGSRLTRRAHGAGGRVWAHGGSRLENLRVASAVGRALEALGRDEPVEVVLGTDLPLPLPASHHALDSLARAWVDGEPPALVPAPFAAAVVPRALFFESLMNSDLPHNDRELSQGVLHMVSALAGTGTEVVLANVKMHIVGTERPVEGLEQLQSVLTEPVSLVCITLLEGYFDGVEELIATLRALGCRAHIAVGGVMPTLAPEHVAAHLGDVSFVCRGAGEVLVPQLCRIVGTGDVDTPLTEGQRAALLALDGIIAFDPAGGVLGCRSDRVVEVADLDRVTLDLSHLQERHVEGGIEIVTSRGCIHRCTFCSILGRESYQARSAGNIFEVLARYEARFAEMFGVRLPNNVHRVHVADDDFGCDPERMKAFFEQLRDTPFRLSSAQVAIGDLCVSEDGVLQPRVDDALLDAMHPSCFADHGRALPRRDFVADHKSRNWSSFLQIGIESFSDRELARLGKGYKVTHIRAVVGALARRELHHDAYLILSNSQTAGEDLVDVLCEIARHKLRYPVHFHARFPVVPRLVSYFTSASHRRMVRQGRTDQQVVRRWLRHADAPELDYPLVDHDVSTDPWVEAAVAPGAEDPAQGLFTDEHRYIGSLERLRERWLALLDTLPDRQHGERLVRRLDDVRRRLVFGLVADAREGGGRDWPELQLDAEVAVGTAEGLLGPKETWLPQFSRFCHDSVPRLVVIPTWQCELRCTYCFIPKQDGRVMSLETLERSLDLLLSSDRPALTLQFFGGEALLEWDFVQHAIVEGTRRARARGKHLGFILSSNGYSLDADKLAWLGQYPVKLELSLDGMPDVQNSQRGSFGRRTDSYENGIARHVELINDSGLPYDVIMVVHPRNAHRVDESFLHIAGLGFTRIQINFALGFRWKPEQKQALAQGLFRMGKALLARGEAAPVFINAEQPAMPIRLNGEITVDHDGVVYGGNGFLHETQHKEKFRLGHLDDLRNFDRYWLDTLDNHELLTWSYPDDVTTNNLSVGRVMTSFVRWLRTQRGQDPSR